MAEGERIERQCAKCELTDSHGHHTNYVAFTHPISKQPVDLSITKHVQCCASDGCELCQTAMKHARVALNDDDALEPGERFNEFLQNPPREYLAELFEVHGITSPEFDYTKEESRPT